MTTTINKGYIVIPQEGTIPSRTNKSYLRTNSSGSLEVYPAEDIGQSVTLGQDLIGYMLDSEYLTNSAATMNLSFSGHGQDTIKVVITGGTTHTAVSALYMRMNGDTGNNYTYYTTQYYVSSKATAANAALTDRIFINNMPHSQTGAGIDGRATIELFIMNANSTSRRKHVALDANEYMIAGSYGTSVGGGQWANTTDAITSLTLFLANGNFVTGTYAAVFGMGVIT